MLLLSSSNVFNDSTKPDVLLSHCYLSYYGINIRHYYTTASWLLCLWWCYRVYLWGVCCIRFPYQLDGVCLGGGNIQQEGQETGGQQRQAWRHDIIIFPQLKKRKHNATTIDIVRDPSALSLFDLHRRRLENGDFVQRRSSVHVLLSCLKYIRVASWIKTNINIA